MAPITIAVAGAGSRGAGYARWALRHPDRARVVAIAEPRAVRRTHFAAEHGIPAADAVARSSTRRSQGTSEIVLDGDLGRSDKHGCRARNRRVGGRRQ